MSRFYIIILFFTLCSSVVGQSKLGSYLKYAAEKSHAGDYYYAIKLYEKALEIDSNSVSILWNYAETLRAYKDYEKAAIYYDKVYDKENGSIYPLSLIYLGLMQKQNGQYDIALETFKKAKKKYTKNKKEYAYLKASKELESCLWVKNAQKDTLEIDFQRLPETINTTNSEFGHVYKNNVFIFSSLRADSTGTDEEAYATNYRTKLYQSTNENGTFEPAIALTELNQADMHVGNGTYSIDGQRYYYSACKDNGAGYTCKIMVATVENDRWTSIDSLGDIINELGSNTSMPNIGLFENQEVLFFASDRKGTKGGMDLWYSVIKNGNQYANPVNIKSLNSIENELNPWWDPKTKQLYFSSSWHNGFGGYDVFSSQFNAQFETPVNIGIPFNSPANDVYYFKSGDTSFVSSNRRGVLFSKNPTCCSDIFSGTPPKVIQSTETPTETLAELNKRLPVTLYFHNDCPNPKSRDTVTQLNYLKTYEEYRSLLGKYQTEYANGLSNELVAEAKEDIESFFIEYVDQGVTNLNLFSELLLKELERGSRLTLIIKGFASPLAESDYNLNLTKRRIASFINYLKEFGQGEFQNYLNGTAENNATLCIKEVPFGEYKANKFISDNYHDQKNSVYSKAAALERKIEIQSIEYSK